MALRIVTAEEEGLASAIADTEHEIFSEANGNEPLDKDGDKSLELMGDDLEGRTTEADEEEPELEASDETGEAEQEKEAATEDEPARDERTGQFTKEARIPPGRLREEAEKRRTAEAEAQTLRDQIAELRGRLDQIGRQPNQQQQEQKAEPPDMFSDPVGWQKHQTETLLNAITARNVETSLSQAAEDHGEAFTKAYSELQRIGNTEKNQFGTSPTVSKIWSSPNPGRALMTWHSQQNILREVGNDPNAYREKLQSELLSDPKFLAKAIEAAKGSARGGSNGARTITRLPPSLNGESGGRHTLNDADPEMFNNSEGSVFDYATRN